MKKTKRMVLWDGSCIVHETFSERELIKLKVRNSDKKMSPRMSNILRHADFIGSTSALLKFTFTQIFQKNL